MLLAAVLAASLAADLDHIIATAPTLRGAHVGLLVETTDGIPVYAHNADDTLQPASTLKLLVGSAALERLGPAYRFTTTLTRTPLPNGDDALVLHGGGDPLLRRGDLDAAAEAAQKAGVVRAQVTLDESHVAPDEGRAPGWSVDDFLAYYAPVVNGLPFEENVLPLTLEPGPAIGAPPVLELPAPFSPLPRGDGCVPGPTLLTFTMAAQTVAAGQPDTSDVKAGQCGDIVITGGVPLGGPAHVGAAVDQPEALALAYFTDALRRRGILVPASQGPPSNGGTIVWQHESEPLSAMLADMWQPSDNLIAEELLRELDVAANAHPGTIQGGVAIERAWLRSIGVDPATLTIADGSGLSQYNRVTPRALGAILLHDWRSPNHRIALDALPIAGVRGDLRGAMQGSTAAGRVFAKTGSMMHVRGLAGFVDSRSAGTLIFALNVDDWMGTDADMAALRMAIAVRLAQ